MAVLLRFQVGSLQNRSNVVVVVLQCSAVWHEQLALQWIAL